MKNQEFDTTIPIALALPNTLAPINCCNCVETEIFCSLLNVNHYPGNHKTLIRRNNQNFALKMQQKDERDWNKQKLSQILRQQILYKWTSI
jgi:hypothetical protein